MGIRVRAANRVKTDNDNWAHGIVANIQEGVGKSTVRKSKTDFDEHEFERFEFVLQVEGTVEPIEITVYTSTKLNPKVQEWIGRGKSRKPVYTRLTTLCLSLGLIDDNELESDFTPATIDRVTESLNDLIGEKIRFKLGNVEGKTIAVPLLDTFERVK